jgi:cell division transport system permease protein
VRSWLRQHRGASALALRKLAAQKSASALSALVIGIALSLPSGGYALLAGLRLPERPLALGPQISVFLKREAPRAEGEALGSRLAADPRVREARLVPREQALQELHATEGLAEVIAALGHNPLPDTLVVRPKDPEPGALEALARELRAQPAVAHVQSDPVWARRLGALAATARLAIALLAALLATALVAVTYNTIRLQILTQRDEIEVSRLIGATDAFIRRPFYYLGLIQGLAGGAIALAIVAGGLAVLNIGVAELARAYGSNFRLEYPAPGDALAIWAFSGLLGWLGAHLSVSIYLLEIEHF